ncbi:MAG TPA: hypothetical protein VJY33_08820 [Isosphaeraceae bacterium]|nr:hypothetical protein [Isosphaeraceae bacterium]
MGVGAISPSLLAESSGISRASSEPRSWWTRLELRPVVDAIWWMDKLRLISLDDGPDPLPLSPFQSLHGEAQAGGELLFAPDPFFQLVVGLHPSRLGSGLLAVQETGRLSVDFCSDAP